MTKVGVSNELELLSSVCVPRLETAGVRRAEAAAARGIDWARMFELGIPHGVLPLLSFHLDDQLTGLAPQPVAKQLKRFRAKVAERGALLTAQLLSVMRALNLEGIRAIPFKGLTLADYAYGDLSLRELHDLDVFVAPGDLPRIAGVMSANEFRPAYHVRGRAEALQAGVPVPMMDSQEYISQDGKTVFEFHDELVNPDFTFPLGFEEAWARRSSVVLGGMELASLDADDLLIYLCVHGARHVWRRLNWTADITALLTRHPVRDADQLLRRAGELQSRRRLIAGLAMAREIAGFEIRNEELTAAVDHCTAVPQMVRHCAAALSGLPDLKSTREVLAGLLFHLRASDSMESRRGVLRYYYDTKVRHVDPESMVVPPAGDTRLVHAVMRWFKKPA